MNCICDPFCKLIDKTIYPILPNFLKTTWDHPAGCKTVFFWAPTIKWCLVLAGLVDLMRPADKLSFYQNVALFFTGGIWTRYSFAITPINYNLASVNIFLCGVALFQLARLGYYGAFIAPSINGTVVNTTFD
ncbi:putative mitochondrial pyruvate carrier [Dirofilaria immitis]